MWWIDLWNYYSLNVKRMLGPNSLNIWHLHATTWRAFMRVIACIFYTHIAQHRSAIPNCIYKHIFWYNFWPKLLSSISLRCANPVPYPMKLPWIHWRRGHPDEQLPSPCAWPLLSSSSAEMFPLRKKRFVATGQIFCRGGWWWSRLYSDVLRIPETSRPYKWNSRGGWWLSHPYKCPGINTSDL